MPTIHELAFPKVGWVSAVGTSLKAPVSKPVPVSQPAALPPVPVPVPAATSAGDPATRVTVVHLFTSTDYSSYVALPTLAHLKREFGKDGLCVMAIHAQDENVNGDDFEDRVRDLDLAVMYDRTGRLASRYPYSQLPTTYILDQEGRVLEVREGPEGVVSLGRRLRELLLNQPLTP